MFLTYKMMGLRRRLGLPEIYTSRLKAFARKFKRDLSLGERGDAKTISIIVPCYCHAQYLKTTIFSITNQVRKPDQVIFVNDCSPDETSEVLKAIIEHDTSGINFKIITNTQNLGQAESINRGIKEASTDLIMILNDDDYLFHDLIDIVFEMFNKYSDIFLFGGCSASFKHDSDLELNPKFIRQSARTAEIPAHRHDSYEVLFYKKFNDLNMAHSGCCFFKKAWKAVGGYYPLRKRVVPFSDRDFQLRLNALFPVAVSYQVPLSYWRANSSVDAGINS